MINIFFLLIVNNIKFLEDLNNIQKFFFFFYLYPYIKNKHYVIHNISNNKN